MLFHLLQSLVCLESLSFSLTRLVWQAQTSIWQCWLVCIFSPKTANTLGVSCFKKEKIYTHRLPFHHLLWYDQMWQKCDVLCPWIFPTTTVEKVATNEWAVSHFDDNGITSKHSQGIEYIQFIYNSKWTLLHMCFGAHRNSPISPVYSYHCRHNPCHASMMLPGTYWALVESILYSSWYLDAAHMDTDRNMLRESGVEKIRRKKRKEKQERDAIQDAITICIHLHHVAECNHFIT